MFKKVGLRKRVVYLLVMVFVVTSCFIGTPAIEAEAVTPAWSTFFSYADIEECSTYNVPGSDGDLWPVAWAEDGNLYGVNGDGKGFGTSFADINANRISGDPYSRNITGAVLTSNISRIWTAGNYNRKPTGMICVDGVLYCAVQDLNTDFNDAPAATICKSTDKGRTWTWDNSTPMFGNYKFTTIMFLDYGKNNQYGTDGYVYAYGIDNNWRDSFNDRVQDPTQLFLARVPKASIMDRSKWEFYTGDLNGNAAWSADINAKKPVLQDDTRLYVNTCFAPGRGNDPKNFTIISQGSIVYNQPLNRYIYSAWTEYTFEFYESPSPFGPWKKFLSKDYGAYIWTSAKNGGYATTIPSKFISSDGKTMWVQSNTFMGAATNYCYSLRKLVVQPYTSSTPSNGKNSSNLALPANAPGVVPFSTCFHFGNKGFLNDGNRNQSEDSWNGVLKTEDYWGYKYPKAYNMNRLVYTTGTIFSDGGGFDNLRVQVRRNFNWIDVTGLTMNPVSTAGNNITYTLSFDDTWGDAVRIVGAPGGASRFTSISELEVYYAANVNPNLVQDSGFENQTTTVISSPWQTEGADSKGIDRGLGFANSGSNNAYIRTATTDIWNCLKQTIAVTPNTNYRLTGYIKNSNNFTNKGYFGVRNPNGSVLKEFNFSGNRPNYSEVAVDFNSGANTSITVFGGFWSVGYDAWVQFDDIVLRQQ